jgi:DNA ligase-1
MTNLPTLYKKTSTGAIERWDISIEGATITTRHGIDGGKIQETSDTIKAGKNLGKANATTPEAQAEAEAKASWEKKKARKGYVEDKARATAGETDAAGGYQPMLAHKFSEHGDKVKYPVYVQPKFDGIRCIAVVEDGRCTLWSRTRKQIHSCPHIERAVEALGIDVVLDGELYTHKLRADFEAIISAVRKDKPTEQSAKIEYHVYDAIREGSFGERFAFLTVRLGHEAKLPLVRAKTFIVANEDEVIDRFEAFRADGYEGLIIRDPEVEYQQKRTTALLKMKEFEDADFPVVGIEEGRGKLQGHVGKFLCQTPDGQVFGAKMAGELSRLKEFFENERLWRGRKLVVSYQNLTKKGIPRCPVGRRFKDAVEG